MQSYRIHIMIFNIISRICPWSSIPVCIISVICCIFLTAFEGHIMGVTKERKRKRGREEERKREREGEKEKKRVRKNKRIGIK